MTTAVYGGSFDPPHIGHLSMVVQALAYPGVRNVMVIPCLEQIGKGLTHFEHRLAMCQKAFSDMPSTVYVSALERGLGGVSYTYRTLEALQSFSPDEDFQLVIGEDLRDKVTSWMNWDRIKVPLICLPRSGQVSSSAVREAFKSSDWRDGFKYLPQSVAQYIMTHHLYGVENAP